MKVDFENYKNVIEEWLLKISKNKSRPEYLKNKLQKEAREILSILDNPGGLKRSKLYKQIRDHYYLDEFEMIDKLLSDDNELIIKAFSSKQISDHIDLELIKEVAPKRGAAARYGFADASIKSELISNIKKLIKLEEINSLAENLIKENWREMKDKIKLEDWSQTKANGKLLYLDKLGILDVLRKSQPFNTSNNSLANILTAITGEKIDTLQPILSAMERKNSTNKNNPYNSIKLIKKVEANLSKLKFEQNPRISTLLGKK